MEIPVQVGHELTVEIESIGVKGDGMFKIEGFVVFVPNTIKGKTYKVRITSVGKKCAFGEVIK